MKSDHTAGPWLINKQDIIGNEPNGYICTWSGRSANAKLIAAAPDLLYALEYLTKQINLSELNVRKDFSLMNGHAAASKAIKKAKGEL